MSILLQSCQHFHPHFKDKESEAGLLTDLRPGQSDTLSQYRSWDTNPGVSGAPAKEVLPLLASSISDQAAGEMKSGASFSLCPALLPALASALPGAHISVLFIVFLPLLFLLELHTLFEPSSGYSEEVITHLNYGLDVAKWVGTQWDKGEVTAKGRD